MKIQKMNFCLILTAYLLLNAAPTFSQLKGLETITEEELRFHLEFIAGDEFRGRETPSPELEICNLYLANLAKHYGLKPILPDGSFYQTIPLNVRRVFHPNTRLHLISDRGEQIFYYEREFGGSFGSSGTFSGDVVFLGFGMSNPNKGWDDSKDIDVFGKVVIILDGQLPEDHEYGSIANRLWSRAYALRDKGAAAVLSVINVEREEKKASGINIFQNLPRGRLAASYETQRTARSSRSSSAAGREERPNRPPLPFARAEISHDAATAILGISKTELQEMFSKIKRGKQIRGKELEGKRIQLNVEVETKKETTRSVIGMVEGSDPVLKNEYIVICGHQDHNGIRGGEIMNGADDNGSATVALLEIAQALLIDRPKRSVILGWFTGEERGLIGSHYFVNNCPVPVEKISACLNMDMLCRNDPDSLYLVASDLLSSELDGTIHKVNDQHKIDFGFSYLYSNRTHPQRVYYRSDQYPHIRFGIPSVWFFCGFTPDYHTPKDDLEFVDYKKMLKATKLVYSTAYEIGNMKNLLKLDVNPDVTLRGKHNLSVESIK